MFGVSLRVRHQSLEFSLEFRVGFRVCMDLARTICEPTASCQEFKALLGAAGLIGIQAGLGFRVILVACFVVG